MITNANPRAWLDAMREIETEGERTPAQMYRDRAPVTIRGTKLINLNGVWITPETAAAILNGEGA